MNLENLNLVELNAQEVKNTAGGFRIKLSLFNFNLVSYGTGGEGWNTDLW
jgi:hypothetical protein